MVCARHGCWWRWTTKAGAYSVSVTVLPAFRHSGIWVIYTTRIPSAPRLAETSGWLMATELRAVDVDFSFARCSISTAV